MYTELVTKINKKAKAFGSRLVRIQTLNDQLITRSEKLIGEISELVGSIQKENVRMCTICLTKPLSMCLINCGHCMCEDCSNRCARGRCYICRATVTEKIKIFGL